jgi:small conductance mechanosensitive channel
MDWDWRKFYDRAYDWIISYGPRIVLASAVFLVGLWVIRLMNKWLKKGFERRRVNPSIRYFLQNLFAISMQVLLVFLVLQVAGIQLTFFAAIVAGLSVAAGLALSGTLQNFVSGILILVLRPYVVGENVVMQGQEGTVTSIQPFFTTILTIDNKTIIVPNGQLSNNVVINLSRQGKRRMDIVVKFNYTVSFDQVKQIVENAVRSTSDILDEPKARIGVADMEFDRYSVGILVWVKAGTFENAKFILQERIMNDLKGAGVIAGAD